MKIKGIKYTAPCLDGSGYAKASRGNIVALHEAGVPITVNPISFESARPDFGKEGDIIESLVSKKIDYNVNLIHTTPEFWSTYREEGVLNVGYTIWETTELHKDWPDYINKNVDLCLVGCEWNVDVFKNSGVTVPVVSVPHGITKEIFENNSYCDIGDISKDTFVFYSVFQWCYDEKTRVLTKGGFKFFKDLSYDDYIATMNLDTEELEYQLPEKIVSFRRKGKMFSLKSSQFNVCVTPDHKMVVKDTTGHENKYKLVPFNELEFDGNKISDKYKAPVITGNVNDLSLDFLEESMSNADFSIEDYDGYVYCATVPNHVMLVERGGKVIFSGNTERKNPLDLIKSYWYAFRNDEDVALVLKTYRSDYSDAEKDAIRLTVKRLKMVTPSNSYPKISLILNMLSEEEIAGLHNRGDCFVSLDRGEGFGLSGFTAGAKGNPIIVTGFGGATEYAKPDNSYLVDYQLTPVFGMPYTKWYSINQLWAQPDICHASKLMRHVYNNREEAKNTGLKLQNYIKSNFIYDKIADKIINSIEDNL